MTIKRLSPADVPAYRRLRLRGLRESPAAFGSSYAEEVKRPLKAFAARLEPSADRWVFGAFVGGRLSGVVTLIREEKKKERHKASIYGLYVDPKVRQQGIGAQLIARVMATARRMRGLKQIRLGVVESNRPARRLYENAGFEVYGRERDALLVAGRFHAELLLVCFL
jgi:ribosomal protein S18 acetylase RimI-like enzyme